MGMSVGENKGGAMAEMNVVPLIDILLVLLVIFMLITPLSTGLNVVIPQQAKEPGYTPPDYLIVVQVLAHGTLRINQEPVEFQNLEARLGEIFKMRASRVAFVRGEGALEFGAVARAIDVMRGSGITSVGLMTPELENAR